MLSILMFKIEILPEKAHMLSNIYKNFNVLAGSGPKVQRNKFVDDVRLSRMEIGTLSPEFRQAYTGLFQLVSSGLFDKYVDFIDTYAGIGELEQQELYNEIVQHKETAMLAQYIRSKGIEQGIEQGIIQKAKTDIIDILRLRFGKVPHEIVDTINRTDDLKVLDSYFKQGVQITGIDQLRFF